MYACRTEKEGLLPGFSPQKKAALLHKRWECTEVRWHDENRDEAPNAVPDDPRRIPQAAVEHAVTLGIEPLYCSAKCRRRKNSRDNYAGRRKVGHVPPSRANRSRKKAARSTMPRPKRRTD